MRSCFLTDSHHPLPIPVLVNPDPSTFLGDDSFYQCVENPSGSRELAHIGLHEGKTDYSLTGIQLPPDVVAVGVAITKQLLLLTVPLPRDKCTVRTVDFGRKTVGIVEHSHIPLPEGTELIRAEFSSHEQLALLLRAVPAQSASWFAKLLLRYHIGTAASQGLSIAVCDTEGRDMRVLTHLDGHTDESDDRIVAAVQVHWLPSGHDLSFMDKQALWLLPVSR